MVDKKNIYIYVYRCYNYQFLVFTVVLDENKGQYLLNKKNEMKILLYNSMCHNQCYTIIIIINIILIRSSSRRSSREWHYCKASASAVYEAFLNAPQQGRSLKTFQEVVLTKQSQK